MLFTRKKDILTYASMWINLEDMLREINQSQEYECCMILLVCST